nr:hypothetical protein [Tanacetum cinerariifolium]
KKSVAEPAPPARDSRDVKTMKGCSIGSKNSSSSNYGQTRRQKSFGVDAAKDFKENMLSDYCCQDKLMLPGQVKTAETKVC